MEGIIKEFFKDGTLSSIGKYRNGKNIGQWRTYGVNGKLIKTIGSKPR